jgi:hypothetical protein
MLASELIAKSWYFSGIVARGFESVSGQELEDGLMLLNDLLAANNMLGNKFPYQSDITLNTIAGQFSYDVQGLIKITSITFKDGSLRWGMIRDSRRDFQGSTRVDDIESLPYHYHEERALNKMIVNLYFIPDKAYEINIHGLFKYPVVSLSADVSSLFEDFYITYLVYELASWICDFRDVDLPARVERRRKILEDNVKQVFVPDMKSVKVNALPSSGSPITAKRLGQGFQP